MREVDPGRLGDAGEIEPRVILKTSQAIARAPTIGHDGADYGGMNEAYRTFWTSAPPARTTVIVKGLVVPGAKLEIECNAVMPSK